VVFNNKTIQARRISQVEKHLEHYIQGLKQMNDRKSNNDTLIITKSLKDVMVFYEFIGDRYDVIAPHSETYIYRDLSKVFICQAKS
jgi:hypothetical protein